MTAPLRRAPRSRHRERFVTASELAEYAYCRRAWWLRAVQGIEGEGEGARLAQGRAAHRIHALTLLGARASAAVAAGSLLGALLYWLLRAR